MRGTVFLIALVLIVPITTGLAAAEHPRIKDYQLGSVPFGKVMDDVLKDFEGIDIVREETPFIESIGNYALGSYFEGGLEEREDQGVCFNPKIVQKYTVTGAGGSGVRNMTLYFQGFELPQRPYALFMFKKTYKTDDTLRRNLRTVFDRWAQPISESIGSKPEVREGTFQDFNGQIHDYFRPALVGVWDVKDRLVFLMISDSMEGPGDPEVIIVDKKGLKVYLEACKILRDGG